jgi:hypothetical protein
LGFLSQLSPLKKWRYCFWLAVGLQSCFCLLFTQTFPTLPKTVFSPNRDEILISFASNVKNTFENEIILAYPPVSYYRQVTTMLLNYAI